MLQSIREHAYVLLQRPQVTGKNPAIAAAGGDQGHFIDAAQGSLQRPASNPIQEVRSLGKSHIAGCNCRLQIAQTGGNVRGGILTKLLN